MKHWGKSRLMCQSKGDFFNLSLMLVQNGGGLQSDAAGAD